MKFKTNLTKTNHTLNDLNFIGFKFYSENIDLS